MKLQYAQLLIQQIIKMNNILVKVKNWLEEEIKHNEPVVEGEEELSDGTEDIFVGRFDRDWETIIEHTEAS